MSAKISSGCSIPIDNLTYPGVTPAFNFSSEESCEWVVEAG